MGDIVAFLPIVRQTAELHNLSLTEGHNLYCYMREWLKSHDDIEHLADVAEAFVAMDRIHNQCEDDSFKQTVFTLYSFIPYFLVREKGLDEVQSNHLYASYWLSLPRSYALDNSYVIKAKLEASIN